VVELKAQLGATIEFASKDDIDAMGDSLMDRMGELNKRPLPRYFDQIAQGSDIKSASSPYQLSLGGPPIGFMWDIMGVTTCGLDDFTAVTGKVALYCGDLTNMSLLALKVPNLAIPSYTSVGRNRIWCQPGQEVFVSISDVADSTVVTAKIQVAEWRQKDVIASAAV